VLLGAALAYWVYAWEIVGIFIQEEQTRSLGQDCLKINSLGFIFFSLNLIFGRALQGAGDTTSPLVITALCRLPFLLGLLYFLPGMFEKGTDGLWYGFVAAAGLEGLLKFGWFQTGRWKMQRV
jgi:Na+-driven multidrug efflux pump